MLWVSCRNDLYAPGLEQAGLSSADLIHAQPRDDAALLAVVEDAVRDGTPIFFTPCTAAGRCRRRAVSRQPASQETRP